MDPLAPLLTREADATGEVVLVVAAPTTCPGCGTSWGGQPACPRCLLARCDVAGLLRQGCDAYERARAAAMTGRYAEAARHLEDLRRCAIPTLREHPAVRRLTDLCALVNSHCDDTARADYALARRAAGEGDWLAAAAASTRAVQTAPALLPARKLHLLCLYAAGQTARAERLRRDLFAVIPGDLDLARWRFAPEPLVVRPARRDRTHASRPKSRPPVPRIPRRAAAATGVKRAWPDSPVMFWTGGLALGGFLTAMVALVISVMVALRQPSVSGGATLEPRLVAHLSPSPTLPGSPVSPDTLGPPSPTPVPDRFAAVRQEADERQARVWFNAASQARREGRLPDAIALAEMAHQTGPSTYLADEALLLRAQCADNLNSRMAAEWYARVAAEKPRSAYAPLALLLAVRVALRQGKPDEAGMYLTWLRDRYPRSPQAAAAQRMDLSSSGESNTTYVHGQRQ